MNPQSYSYQIINGLLAKIDRQSFIKFYCAYNNIPYSEDYYKSLNDKSLLDIISNDESLPLEDFFYNLYGYCPIYALPYKLALYKNKLFYMKNEKLYRVVTADFYGADIVSSDSHVFINGNELIPYYRLFIKTDKCCPKCGEPLYVSHTLGYDYECLECDEDFYECECQ